VGTRLGVILLCADMGLTALALYVARWLRLALPFGIYLDEPLAFGPGFYLLVPAIWGVSFFALRVYDSAHTMRYPDDFQVVWSAITWSALIFAGIAYLFFREFSRLLFFYFYLLDVLFLIGWRVVLRYGLRSRWGRFLNTPWRVLIVGAGVLGRELGEALATYHWTGIRLVGYVDDDADKQGRTIAGRSVLGALDEIETIVTAQQVNEVLLALPPQAQERTRCIVLRLQALPVNVRLVPDIFDLVFIRASVEELAGIPLIGLREPVIEGPDRVLKRLFDLIVGGAALILFSPIMLLAAVAIRLDSPGPVFIGQARAGEGGRTFLMLKFRTMIEGAEALEQTLARGNGDGPPVFLKRPDDPRITRVGHILRRFSIDELPQLINVLRGEMSLVGPRPELPWLVAQYQPQHRKRFAVPQGMTGWWQVNGRSNRADYALRIEDDLYYIRNWSLWLDLRILWMTVGAVLRGEGAY